MATANNVRELTNEKCFLVGNHCFRSDHVSVPLPSSKQAFDIFHITENSLSLSSSFLKDGFSYKKVKHSNGFTTSKIFQCYMQIFFINSKCRNYIFIQILNKTSGYIYPKMYLLMEHRK